MAERVKLGVVISTVSEINDADASDVRQSGVNPPKDGNYGSISSNETGKIVAPPANTDQV